MTPLPQTLQDAIENGELTEAQVRELIAFEAQAIGLHYEQAVKRARARLLPNNPIGADIELLVELLAD